MIIIQISNDTKIWHI